MSETQSQRESVYVLLEQVKLPTSSKEYITHVIENACQDPETLSIINDLLSIAKKNDARCELRLNMKPVDAMESFQGVSKPVLTTLLLSLYTFQMVDGCTGGCSWCGIRDVNRRPGRYFSLSSFERFIKEHGSLLPRPFCMYEASDISEITDGNHTFLSWVKAVVDNSKDLSISCFTSIPAGTEFAVMEFLEYVYENSLTSRVLLSISIKDDNFETWEKIKTILQKRGVSREFLDSIKTEDRRGKIYSVGKAFQPEQKRLEDLIGIVCYDGINYYPHEDPSQRIRSRELVIVSSENPSGYIEEILDPKGDITIPGYIHNTGYGFPGVLPQVGYRRFSNGTFVEGGIKTSFQRDALSVVIARYGWEGIKGTKQVTEKMRRLFREEFRTLRARILEKLPEQKDRFLAGRVKEVIDELSEI